MARTRFETDLAKLRASWRVPLVHSAEAVVRRSIDLAGVGPGDVAVDVGCGHGEWCIAAARRGANVIGIDIDLDMLSQAEKKARAAGVAEICEWRQGDFMLENFTIPHGATVIYMFLAPFAINRLEIQCRRCLQNFPGCRIVTFQSHLETTPPVSEILYDMLRLYTVESLRNGSQGVAIEQEYLGIRHGSSSSMDRALLLNELD